MRVDVAPAQVLPNLLPDLYTVHLSFGKGKIEFADCILLTLALYLVVVADAIDPRCDKLSRQCSVSIKKL